MFVLFRSYKLACVDLLTVGNLKNKRKQTNESRLITPHFHQVITKEEGN